VGHVQGAFYCNSAMILHHSMLQFWGDSSLAAGFPHFASDVCLQGFPPADIDWATVTALAKIKKKVK
jgi:hypothetical protein